MSRRTPPHRSSEAMPRPYRICVVCSGNICRSPMGEIVLRDFFDQAGLSDRVEVDSAGVSGWHVGDPADRRTLTALRAAGYDGSAHRASQFDRAWLASRDLILVADRTHLRDLRAMGRAAEDPGHVRLLREFDPEAVAAGTLDVDDPYFGDATGFDRCLAEVEAACRGVVEYVAQELPRRG